MHGGVPRADQVRLQVHLLHRLWTGLVVVVIITGLVAVVLVVIITGLVVVVVITGLVGLVAVGSGHWATLVSY